MAYLSYLRNKARELRASKRLTIDQLADRLGVYRTTVYYWVKDMPIPGSGSGGGWPESARRKGTRAMQRKYRELREEAYEEGTREFSDLAADPTFRDFVCLYLAEGSKRSRKHRRDLQLRPGDRSAWGPLDSAQRKSNSNGLTGRQWRSKYGVLTVSAGDTCLRWRLEAWMDRLRESWV